MQISLFSGIEVPVFFLKVYKKELFSFEKTILCNFPHLALLNMSHRSQKKKKKAKLIS